MRCIKTLFIYFVSLFVTALSFGAENPLDGGWGDGNHKTAINAIRKIEKSLLKNYTGSLAQFQTSAEMVRLITFAEEQNFTSQTAYARASDDLKGILGISASFGVMGGPEGRHVTRGFSVDENKSDYNTHISVRIHFPAYHDPVEFFGQSGHRFSVTIFRFPDNSVTVSVDAGKTVENKWNFRKSGVKRTWDLSSGKKISWKQGYTESSNGIVSL